MKKVISVWMCLLLCFSFPVTSSAETVSHNALQPYYEKASEAKSELTINGTTATCKSTLKGDPNVKRKVSSENSFHAYGQAGRY